MRQQARGERALATAAAVMAHDRWNSFDRFRQTTQVLAKSYDSTGAAVEVHAIPTGGQPGTGEWSITEAADVHEATLDVTAPIRLRVADYGKNPWQLIQWSAATADEGLEGLLRVVDSVAELQAIQADGLRGQIVLTSLDPREWWAVFAAKGALALLAEHAVPGLPEVTAWQKFGWGGVPIDQAALRLAGFSLSATAGAQLRALCQLHGMLTLRARVDLKRYVGSHDLVCGLLHGRTDPQDEVWVLAHSSEPGAIDNASGVAVSVEIARLLNGLFEAGTMPRPRRTIRLLHGFECYSFFHYLQHVPRLQAPLAGVCIDSVGARPNVCDGLLTWRATVPASAGFVNQVGEVILRATLRRGQAGYRLAPGPFVSTSDTLLGDPQFGFPCPWLTNCYKHNGYYPAYHTSADTLDLLSAEGLADCVVGMAAYLYYLADATTPDVLALATAETARATQQIGQAAQPAAAYWREQHHISLQRLQRWLWGGERASIMRHLGDCEAQVRAAMPVQTAAKRGPRGQAGAVPRRAKPLTPSPENTQATVSAAITATQLPAWALFWANGRRSLGEIASLLSVELAQPVTLAQVRRYFAAHADLGYVTVTPQSELVTQRKIETDLRALGLRSGMDVMVHSALSRIGHVAGGPDSVVEALLAVVGPSGTVLAPSFNHRAAQVYNALTTPTINGAVADALWRRPEAVRSQQPTHAVAAIGQRADFYCDGHLEAGIWAADSPIGRLVHGGGYILSVGVTHEATTAYHVAEIALGVPCIDSQGNVQRLVLPNGEVHAVAGMAFRSAACPMPPARLDEVLNRRKRQRHGMVGHAAASLTRALDVYEERQLQLRGICSACAIRPVLEPTAIPLGSVLK